MWSVFFGEDGCGDGAMQQEGRIATRLASERGRARATQDPRDACPPSASSERASERAGEVIALPTKYKSSVLRAAVEPADIAVPSRAEEASRGRSFRWLGIKRRNHLSRCRFLEFLCGARPAGPGHEETN